MRLDQVGPGYEELTDAARRAIDDAGRCEGLVLDPVYTAKAMAGLAAAVADGRHPAGGEDRLRPHGRPSRASSATRYAAELTSRVTQQSS